MRLPYSGFILREKMVACSADLLLCAKILFANVEDNGSHKLITLLHFRRNLPDLVYEDFAKLDLSRYSWIHFEVNRPLA